MLISIPKLFFSNLFTGTFLSLFYVGLCFFKIFVWYFLTSPAFKLIIKTVRQFWNLINLCFF